MSEPPGWYRAARNWAGDRAPQPPAAATSAQVDDEPGGITTIRPAVGSVGDRAVGDRAVGQQTVAERAVVEQPLPPEVNVLRIPVVATRRRERLRRRLVIGVGISLTSLLLLIVVVETVGRSVLQHRVADEIHSTGVATRADVTIGRAWWTPSISRVLLTGTLDMVDVELTSTDVVGVPAESLHWVLFDLGVSVSVRTPRMNVISLGSGDVTVVVDPESFGQMIGISAEIRHGRLYLGNSARPAKVSLQDTDLVIEHPLLGAFTGSESIIFPVSDPYMLPCDPGLEMNDDRMVLSCSGSTVPGVLGQTFGGASSDPPGVDGAEVEIYTPGPIEAGD